MKRILMLVLVMVLAATATYGQSNPYATPDYVDRYAVFTRTLFPILDGLADRKMEITSVDLQLLQALVNNNFSKMTAIFFNLPIKSWAHLFAIEYVSKESTSGEPRRILALGDALLWLTVYDLPLGDAAHPAIRDGDNQPIFPWLSL